MSGTCLLELSVVGRVMQHPFLVADRVNHNMIGADAIHRFGICIEDRNVHIKPSYGNGERIDLSSLDMCKLTPVHMEGALVAKKNVTIRPGCRVKVPTQGHFNKKEWRAQPVEVLCAHKHQALYNGYHEKINKKARACTGRYDIDEHGILHLFVSNTSVHDVEIERGEIYGRNSRNLRNFLFVYYL